MRRVRLLSVCVCALIVFAVSAPRACASLITQFEGTSANLNGTFTYSYEVFLEPRETISGTNGASANVAGGDYLTIYDFSGLVGTPAFTPATAGAVFTLTTENLGITPPKAMPTDDPAILNITAGYTGSRMNASTAEIDLGTITVVSTFGTTTTGNFASQAHALPRGSGQGSATVYIGDTTVAAADPAAEPSSLTLFGVGGLGLAGAVWWRRRKRLLKLA
jgi:hypothetical protein